ncbi:hypothetical protein [Pseudomonas fluorescens]|uniref:hypothetical protein n=1 Tax=Pseudomonas fluorescens TaxID=294 RepID=UPI003D0912F2
MKKIFLLSILLLSGCATSNVYLDIQGAAWRKTEAFSAKQFGVGVIETSGRNRFDPKGSIVVSDFPVVAQTTYFSEETAKAALDAGVQFKPGVVDVSGDFKSQTESRLNSRYVVFRTLDSFALIERMNDPKNLKIMNLIKGLKDPVIVTGTAVAFDNEMFKKVDSGLKANASISAGGSSPAVTLGGNVSTESKTSVSNGTVFAYEYSAIEWDETSKDAKVKNLTIDRPANPWF